MKKLSIYNGVTDKKGVVVSFDTVIHRIRTGGRGLKEKTRIANALEQTDPEGYTQHKLKLPAVTWSGQFRKRGAKHLIEHSGRVVLDVDDTLDLGGVLADFAMNPHIETAFVSPSGVGAKPVIHVEPLPKNDAEHKVAFQAVLDVFDEYVQLDPKELPKQSDVSRLCFLAYDPNLIVNPNPIPIEWDPDDIPEPEPEERQHLESRHWDDSEIDVTALKFIPNDLPYNDWRNVGMAIKHAGLPVSVFQSWSGGQRLNSKGVWITEDIDRYWRSFTQEFGKIVTWGTVVWMAQQNGYELPMKPSQTQKLQKTQEVPPLSTETRTENENNRTAAVAEALATQPDRTQITLITDITGAGKDYTTFAEARKLKKRPIVNPPHLSLAEQAVEEAMKVGFWNARVLRGRDFRWKDSGIENIPVKMRTAPLFSKAPCIMFDQVKTHIEKRIAARTFCEHFCEFRETCLKEGHLKQYVSLGDVDFLATCLPNVLFNPAATGYLEMLLTRGESKPTDTDDAIAASLDIDLQDEEPSRFDMAILNDYTVMELYNKCSVTLDELKQLKTAWAGLETETFADTVMQAFLGLHSADIFKTLKAGIEGLTAEAGFAIKEQLTKHARHGTVKRLERPKGSKETKALLTEYEIRYDDGGRQFIPHTPAAAAELREKNFPILPWDVELSRFKLQHDTQIVIPHGIVHALMANVPLADISPVWQANWTLLDQLQVFVDSVATPENASCYIFDDTLSFDVPPQDSKRLNHIAMLAPTDQSESVKTAFRGQDIDFQVYTGKQIEFAPGVDFYQMSDSRLTSASVLQYPKTADGKRKLNEKPLGFTPKTLKRLAKLNDWANAMDNLSCFISYKEIADMPELRQRLGNFQVVTHFDRISGLNLKGLKFLVVYGYPKVKHEVVMAEAHIQFAGDRVPIPNGNYEELTQVDTFTEDGMTITERRYTDPRLEAVRKQLALDKLAQALGRARWPRWENTTTLLFSNVVLEGITRRATSLFSDAAFSLAETPWDLPAAMERIRQAEAKGDVKEIAEVRQVSQRTARRRSKPVRDEKKVDRDAEICRRKRNKASQKQIATEMGISQDTVKRALEAEICRRFASGDLMEQIATEMGINDTLVCRTLEKQAF